MTQDKIYVEMSQLESKGGEVIKKAEEYKTAYNNFYSKMNQMNSEWKGEDFEAFISRIKEFEKDFTSMYNLMMQYGEYLQKTSKSYEETQALIRKNAQSIEITHS